MDWKEGRFLPVHLWWSSERNLSELLLHSSAWRNLRPRKKRSINHGRQFEFHLENSISHCPYQTVFEKLFFFNHKVIVCWFERHHICKSNILSPVLTDFFLITFTHETVKSILGLVVEPGSAYSTVPHLSFVPWKELMKKTDRSLDIPAIVTTLLTIR